MRSKNRIKKLYPGLDKNKSEFKKEMKELMLSNRALAIAIVETYRAETYQSHIWKTVELLGFNHRIAYKDYCSKLAGEMLCGRDDLWRTLYFAGYENIKEKYCRKIPERLAMGYIHGMAINIANGKE